MKILQASKTLLLTIFLAMTNLASAQSLTVVSWNLKDFGQSRDAKEIALIANEIKHADIVAIQEVVAKHPGGAKAVARLADQLNRMGAKWDYRISDPTRSSSPYKSERYAFLWKTSKVTNTGGRPALISELASAVEREPFLMHFKVNGEVLTILNYHACTHTKAYPEPAEIAAISKWLANQSFANVVWAGDMNLVIDDQAFDQSKRQGYKSVLNGQKTSLKTKCKNGNYLSRAEDNILYKFSTLDFEGGTVLDFIKNGNCSDVSWKRTSLSDHIPIAIEVQFPL